MEFPFRRNTLYFPEKNSTNRLHPCQPESRKGILPGLDSSDNFLLNIAAGQRGQGGFLQTTISTPPLAPYASGGRLRSKCLLEISACKPSPQGWDSSSRPLSVLELSSFRLIHYLGKLSSFIPPPFEVVKSLQLPQ